MASKYSKYSPPEKPKIKSGQLPAWRGIGCLMMIIVPLLSYFGALELLKYGFSKGWLIPIGLLGYVQFPAWVWKVNLLAGIVRPIASYPNFYAVALLTIILLIVLSGIFSYLYSLMYRVIGPSRHTALDSPDMKGRKIKKSR